MHEGPHGNRVVLWNDIDKYMHNISLVIQTFMESAV